MTDADEATNHHVAPPRDAFVLDHLVGPHRGTRQVLAGDVLQIGTGVDAAVHIPCRTSDLSSATPRHPRAARIGLSAGRRARSMCGGQWHLRRDPHPDAKGCRPIRHRGPCRAIPATHAAARALQVDGRSRRRLLRMCAARWRHTGRSNRAVSQGRSPRTAHADNTLGQGQSFRARAGARRYHSRPAGSYGATGTTDDGSAGHGGRDCGCARAG